jgi:hypothetical protein
MSRSTSTKRRHGVIEEGPRVCAVSHKIRYARRKRALTALNFSRAHPPNPSSDRRPVAVYACSHCGGWHLTSKAQAL